MTAFSEYSDLDYESAMHEESAGKGARGPPAWSVRWVRWAKKGRDVLLTGS